MTLVPVSALCVRPLKWVFLFLLVCSLITMWYVTFSSNASPESMNLLYFYEYEPVYRQQRLFTLRERPGCADTDPFLVILVASSPRDVEARQAIRITWGSRDSWWGQRVLTLFLLGQDTHREDKAAALSVEDESILYGDIIRQDFMDTYDNLTLKTIMAFQWFSEFCSNARFFMKTDVDVFINTANLVKLLLQLNSSENVFTGYPFFDNFAFRGFDKKRYISYEEYPFKLYPPYCSGLGYILDGKLALRTYELMSHVKPLKFEDVYVGICLNLLKVNVTVPEDAEQFFLYKIDFDICKKEEIPPLILPRRPTLPRVERPVFNHFIHISKAQFSVVYTSNGQRYRICNCMNIINLDTSTTRGRDYGDVPATLPGIPVWLAPPRSPIVS